MLQLYIICGTFHRRKPGTFFHIESNNEKNATLFLFPPKSRGLMPTSAGSQGLLKQVLKRPNNNYTVRRFEKKETISQVILRHCPAGETALGAVTL